MTSKLFKWQEDEKEHAFFTPWSLVHIMSGAAAKNLGIGFWWFEGLHAFYELKDQMIQPPTNSLTNSLGDQVAGTIGHLIGTKNKDNLWVYGFLGTWVAFMFLPETIG